MGLEKKLKFIKKVETFMVIMTILYWLAHLTRMLGLQLYFNIADPYLQFLPNIFNNFFPTLYMPLFDDDNGIQLGYVLSGGLFFILYYLIKTKVIPPLEAEVEEERENAGAIVYIEKQKEKIEKERKIVKEVQYKEMFYGLLELRLQYFDNFKKNTDELKKLSVNYYKIITEKLKQEYHRVDFMVQDKIFFISDNYSLMHFITVDLLKILNVIVKTNKFNAIKVSTLLSYWVDSKSTKKMNVFRTLSQINALDNENEIIIPAEVYMKIMSFGKRPWCQVNSLGQYRLFNVYNGEDTDIELYKITSVEPKETF